LSESEKLSGNFAENIIYPSFGLQFFQLSGELKGFSVIAQIIYAIDMGDLIAKPYGGLATMYYF
jgi:hypothetical protein